MLFANEAAVRSRGLNHPDRALAMAWAGAVLTRLGRADAGRKLIDEAAHDAAQLGIANRADYYRRSSPRCWPPLMSNKPWRSSSRSTMRTRKKIATGR